MKRLLSRSVTSVLVASLAVGCGDDGANNAETTGSSAPPPPPGVCISEAAPDGTLLLRADAANNYELTVDVAVQSTEFAPGTGLVLDWSALTKDFFRHDIAPGDITSVTLGLWAFQYEDLVEHLKSDTLASAVNVGGITYPIPADRSRTSVPVTEMYIPYQGMDKPQLSDIEGFFDPALTDPAFHSYTVSVNKGDAIKLNVKMIHHGKINPTSTNTTIALTNDSATINATAKIASKAAVLVPPNSAAITVDWKEIPLNAVGRPFEDRSIDRVRVLHFPDTPEALESKVLDLEQSYDREYSGLVTGNEQQTLTTLVDAQGQPFTGIDPTIGGTWMVALMCAAQFCGSPAPWFMARLEACPPPAATP
jgi:hypothetical protein